MAGLLFVLILISFCNVGSPQVSCTCDKITTNTTTPCTYEVDANKTLISASCTCLNSTFAKQLNSTTDTISCYDPYPDEIVETCPDWNVDGVCDEEQNQRCTNTTLPPSRAKIVKYAFYFLAVWIIIWCLATAIVNIVHKNSGHHRVIHLYEELAIIFLAIVIFVLNTSFPSNQNICKIVAILAHFLMVLITAAFLMESKFAKEMVHGKSKRNGCAFPAFNYILPIIIALIPTLITYFMKKTDYALSGRFCFSTAPGDMFWAFVIPAWILIFIAGLQSQLSCLACDKTTKSQDQPQCYWAKKSAKSLLMFALLLFTLWLLVLFAGNEQVVYLFILVFIVALITGPVIFVVHTFCHLNTCEKWGGNGLFGAFYRLCPKKSEPQPKPKPNEEDDDDLITPRTPDPKKEEVAPIPNKAAPPKVAEPPVAPPVPEPKEQPVHTEATHFYSWLTNLDTKARRASDVLFRPKLA